MQTIDYFIYAGMALLVLILLAGLAAMWRGDDASRSWSNKLMRARVLVQFIVIVLLAVAVFWMRN